MAPFFFLLHSNRSWNETNRNKLNKRSKKKKTTKSLWHRTSKSHSNFNSTLISVHFIWFWIPGYLIRTFQKLPIFTPCHFFLCLNRERGLARSNEYWSGGISKKNRLKVETIIGMCAIDANQLNAISFDSYQ